MGHFIQQALIFITATVMLVPLFQFLGFGSVLGYLVAGIIVGPHALGLIHEAEHVLHLAELGVVLLLFIIGLEIQPRKLWSMRRELVGLGGVQVLLCTLAFAAAGMFLGLDPKASFVIGFALSLSSTAFALQYLMEKNQLGTAFGQSSFAILLSQDLVAIPALALIPALASSSHQGEGPGATTLLYFVLLVVGLFAAAHFLLRPLFRLIASMRSRELFTALTLFIVLGVAALMLSIGLSAALGTFIAGVLLAESEYRHELEANLDPFKSLLMGLFFMGVGMSVSLPLLLDKPVVIALLTAGYLLSKSLLIYALGRLRQMTHENAKLMALATGQGGEFAFVIFTLAATLGLAPQEPLALLTAVITLSMALSPVLNLLNERYVAKCAPAMALPQYDVISHENPEIVIAGFGRFGQIFGRMLKSQQIPFVAIDHDASQVDSLRKFGHKVYFGDASRLEILETAGVARAKYFILAIDDMEQSLATAKTLREHFPKVKIFARARNRGHVFEFMELGVEHIKRETFDASLNFVGDLLLDMGVAPERAHQMVERFRKHDEIMLEEQYKVRQDEDMFVSVATQGQAQFNEVMKLDSTQSFLR
jgi:monovalent cation:proton antiporter-2 (CPA2) family protein